MTITDYQPITFGLKLFSYYARASNLSGKSPNAHKVLADTFTRLEVVPQEVLKKYLFLSELGKATKYQLFRSTNQAIRK